MDFAKKYQVDRFISVTKVLPLCKVKGNVKNGWILIIVVCVTFCSNLCLSSLSGQE